MPSFIKIMDVKINNITLKKAVDKVNKFLNGKDTKVIYTPNTEVVMIAKDDDKLKTILNDGDLTIPDGIGLVYASKIKKRPLAERVTGYDLSVEMIKLANKKGYSLFLLGGEKGVAKRASERLKNIYPNLNIAGVHHGYFKGTHIGYKNHEDEKKVIEIINKSNADILFVGFGAPKQEKWIHENKDKLNCKVIIGNGGTIDVLAGKVKRAPKVYQKLGLEWLYRLIKEPWRIKRQMVLPLFMLHVLFSRKNIVK
ncbi:WecB/TagA/CpsF family glycosyltransferase [Thermohalobacter berrensis]|uniref:N-acetylglucosaminyldiphosphoundecaprenol N-acetyl-beta-D-mannosaminyltransferase n=1 Tax=Thermohalobacter berrensis TaxID=99594 RepID=A0A419SY46_9FIRM|nr:WecB/TagA/CpsF family glycosyltransferase [Thermohalobacter berrensis]RKD30079.1 N-acetylmannosaminyltransferase [Thermohalobacter berrensis]